MTRARETAMESPCLKIIAIATALMIITPIAIAQKETIRPGTPAERPWYLAITDWIGITGPTYVASPPPATPLPIPTPTPPPPTSQPATPPPAAPTPIPAPTVIHAPPAGTSSSQGTTSTPAQTASGAPAGTQTQPPQAQTAAATQGTAPTTQTDAETTQTTSTATKPSTREELATFSAEDRRTLLDSLEKPAAQAQTAAAGGTPLKTPAEIKAALIEIRAEQIKKGLTEISDNLKTKRIDTEQAYAKITTLLQQEGLQKGTKEYDSALEAYRSMAKESRTDALRAAADKGTSYAQLSHAQKDLFKDQKDYEAAAKSFIASRELIIQKAAGIFDPKTGKIIQVWDATSWEKLTEDQKRYFTDDTSNPASFVQAQASATSALKDQERDYVLARQEYINQDEMLKKKLAERAKTKDPAQKQQLDEEIAGLQAGVKEAFDKYSKLQPEALAAAYKSQADDLGERIDNLQARAGSLAEGPEKRKLESEIAQLKGAQLQASINARQAKGDLTFGERLYEIVRGYSEFSGLGQFSALFIDDKDMAARRQEAEELFCDKLLISGTQCWTSKICKGSIDATIGGTAVVAKTTSGEPRGAARIQADKSPPGGYYNETTGMTTTSTLYRISYFLLNTNEETMKYNLVFYNADGSTYRAFAKDKELAAGASESRIRTSAIVRYSNKDYVKACLTFKPGIVKLNGGKAREICSKIVSYSGGATTLPQAQLTPSQQAGSGAGQAPGAAAPPKDFEGF